MKTLLLSLVVVAFVYLDSGHTMKCCNNMFCIIPVDCPDEGACYKKTSGGLLNLEVDMGCAANCTLPEAGATMKYCSGYKCNLAL
uniref:Three-finger toxin n=1 Tax=Hypsiglena sp. JMG-2014 TaxID=1550645 RepID=A0A098M253_9SAUR